MNTNIERLEVPGEIWESLDELLDQYRWLIPTWCHDLYVRYEPECPNVAETSIMYRYRKATIVLGNRWIHEDADYRERTLVHELIHIQLGPMVEWTKLLIDRLAGDDAGRIIEEFNERHEASTTDLDFAIRKWWDRA